MKKTNRARTPRMRGVAILSAMLLMLLPGCTEKDKTDGSQDSTGSSTTGSGTNGSVIDETTVPPSQTQAPSDTTAPSAGAKLVALTFDDGPSTHTRRLLELLKKYEFKATFFIVGSRVSNFKETLNLTVDEGHEIASHSFNHPSFKKISAAKVKEENDKTEEAVRQATGGRAVINLMRPPGGDYNDAVKADCRARGWKIINWSVDTQDWRNKTKEPAEAAAAIMQNAFVEGAFGVRDGAVILLHDLHERTVDAMEAFFQRLKDEGYQSVTVSELLRLRREGGAAGEVYTRAIA